jgi:hypothetical protein
MNISPIKNGDRWEAIMCKKHSIPGVEVTATN